MKISLLCFIVLSGACHAQNLFPADPVDSFRKDVQPVLNKRCAQCHGKSKQNANINFTAARTREQLSAEASLWMRMAEQVETGIMPPEDEEPLTPAQRRAVIGWVRGPLFNEIGGIHRREGRSHLRRLSREEWGNTVFDILGIRPAVNRNLPLDGRVDGYDKVSEALPFSASGIEGFIKTAEDTLHTLLTAPKTADPKTNGTTRAHARPSEQSKGHLLELPDGTMVSFNSDLNSGPIGIRDEKGGFRAPPIRVPGVHKLRVSVYGYQTDKPLAFGIYAGHTGAYPQLVSLVGTMSAPPGKPTVLETEVYFRTAPNNDTSPVADNFRLVPFGLGVPVPKNTLASARGTGPGLAVQWVDITEPELPLPGYRFLMADFSEPLRNLIEAQPWDVKKALLAVEGSDGDKKQILAYSNKPNEPFPLSGAGREQLGLSLEKTFRRIGARFFRRDLTAAEATRSVQSFFERLDAGEPPRAVFANSIVKLMTAPDSLSIIEQPGRLNEFALASRLSYFLTNSTPDEELLAQARQGKLGNAETLREQTERLLTSPKAERFIKDFTDQWLGLWALDSTSPDGYVYPEYNDYLKLSSAMETQASFRHMLAKNLSVVDLVAPRWALLNESLAKHYGLPACEGFELRLVELPPDTPFGGVWTQSATMKVTANGTNTSPIKRGVWLADRLLGLKIPPPPPTAGSVTPDIRGATTLREQIAQHSSNGSCKACHSTFDGYGFALESFDVTGAYRTAYRRPNPAVIGLPPHQRKAPTWENGLPVDSAGVTPDGKPFQGIAEVRARLSKNPAQLAQGVVRHLVTYATGQPATAVDTPAVQAIVESTARDEYGLRSLVHGVVQSDVFQMK